MAIENPKKVFQFRIEINGFDQLEAQKVTLPKSEVEVVYHSKGSHQKPTPGQRKTGMLVLEKLRRLDGPDNFFWDRLKAAMNPATGGGVLPSSNEFTCILKEMDSTGLITVTRYINFGCFVASVEPAGYDRMSSDNILEKVEIAVEYMDQL